MAKGSFTRHEHGIWAALIGKGGTGPTSRRRNNLVEEFERRGLVPSMMRISKHGEPEPYARARYAAAMLDSINAKDDSRVMVYYHPEECAREVGSTGTTWVHWAQLVVSDLKAEPICRDLVRLSLPEDVRMTIRARGTPTRSQCTLLSLRMVAFFIAAQHEAWTTAEEVARVAPYKELIARMDFPIIQCVVRSEVDALFEEIASEVGSPRATPVEAAPVEALPLRLATPVAPPAPQTKTAPSPEDAAIDRILDQIDLSPKIAGPVASSIEEEILAAEQHLSSLRLKRELLATVEAFRSGRIAGVSFDGPVLRTVTITLEGGRVVKLTPVEPFLVGDAR